MGERVGQGQEERAARKETECPRMASDGYMCTDKDTGAMEFVTVRAFGALASQTLYHSGGLEG